MSCPSAGMILACSNGHNARMVPSLAYLGGKFSLSWLGALCTLASKGVGLVGTQYTRLRGWRLTHAFVGLLFEL